MFGTQTDPVPYIAAAYGIGILFILGYAMVQIKLRKKLRALDLALRSGESH